MLWLRTRGTERSTVTTDGTCHALRNFISLARTLALVSHHADYLPVNRSKALPGICISACHMRASANSPLYERQTYAEQRVANLEQTLVALTAGAKLEPYYDYIGTLKFYTVLGILYRINHLLRYG